MSRQASGQFFGSLHSDPNVAIIHIGIACCGVAMAVVIAVALISG